MGLICSYVPNVSPSEAICGGGDARGLTSAFVPLGHEHEVLATVTYSLSWERWLTPQLGIGPSLTN